jgi:hypothetical protein
MNSAEILEEFLFRGVAFWGDLSSPVIFRGSELQLRQSSIKNEKGFSPGVLQS